ncbi:MAG TPA: hypothetical protein VMQ76_05315 [Terracidiphilus sp.]|nr:hypothetical protein [Terracidiphilus sp.]
MTHKEIVRVIEPNACIEKTEVGYVVRKHPEGPIIGSNRYAPQAWQSARMRLFGETIRAILSEIPAATK